MLSAIGRRARAWAREMDPFTNVIGLARTLTASAGALTLAFNGTGVMFRPTSGHPHVPVCTGVPAASVYCLGESHLELLRWLCAAVLVVVATGWRPRWTGIAHAYVAWSYQAAATAVEGGDQIHAILAMLLVPVTLCDPRAWHWQRLPEAARISDERLLVTRTCLALVRLQVAGIYFHAAVGKWSVEDWTNGTVLYYWFKNPAFGAPEWMDPIWSFVFARGWLLAALTWSVLVLEALLAAGLLARRRYWPYLMWAGIALHTGIMFVHGLQNFGVVMWAALILYLREPSKPFVLPAFLTARLQPLGVLLAGPCARFVATRSKGPRTSPSTK